MRGTRVRGWLLLASGAGLGAGALAGKRAGDGVWHSPITLHSLRLLAPARLEGAKTEGEFALDRLSIIIQAPASVWAEWDKLHN